MVWVYVVVLGITWCMFAKVIRENIQLRIWLANVGRDLLEARSRAVKPDYCTVCRGRARRGTASEDAGRREVHP